MTLIRKMGSLTAGAVLGSVLLASGCAAHGGYYYDPYGRQYYAPATEDTYIIEWEGETHRRHEEFRHRKEQERREYWEWRHRHGNDHGHDHDHDHDRH